MTQHLRPGQRLVWLSATVAMVIAACGKLWWEGVADHGTANYFTALFA